MPDSNAVPAAAKPPPEPDLSGVQLGDYHLLRRLGRGGMAEVYLAEQTSLRRQVALKILRTALASDEAYVRRFHNEAQSAASLVHANIVQIHEVGCEDGLHFIAQEYVPGQNLKQVLTRNGPLDTRSAIKLLRQVAAALHKAAERGIVHRDIKPENIMISSEGEVKVADFGLARAAIDGKAVDLTQVGITMGTPLYMSPEQVEGRKVDPRSDIYSLGVTCYHILSGRPPFEGQSPLSVAVQHLKTNAEPLEHLRPDVPPGLCRIVHKMLSKKVEDRYQSIAELLKDLRAVRFEGDDVHGDDEWSTPELLALVAHQNEATRHLEAAMHTQAVLIQRRWRWWWVGGGLAAAFAIGAIAAVATRPPPLLMQIEAGAGDVDQQPTAFDQYWYALRLNTEQAFQSVARFHNPADSPGNALYAKMATQRLAEYYRQRDQVAKAEAEYQELADLGTADPQFAAIGMFGIANLYAQQQRHVDVTSRLAAAAQLWELIEPDQRRPIRDVLDERIRPQFDEVLAEYQRGTTSVNQTEGT